MTWHSYRTQNIFVSPCYEKSSKRIKYKMILKNKDDNREFPILFGPIHLEICEDNIYNAGLILIQSTEQLMAILRQFPEQLEIIKKDIDSYLSRYDAPIIKYKFFDEIMAHELEHKQDYLNNLKKLKKDYLDDKINGYSNTCIEFKNDPENKTENAITEYEMTYASDYIDKAILDQSTISEEDVQKRLSVQVSLFDYKLLIFKFENHLIF